MHPHTPEKGMYGFFDVDEMVDRISHTALNRDMRGKEKPLQALSCKGFVVVTVGLEPTTPSM